MSTTYTPPDDGLTPMERRAEQMKADLEAAQWQDHWDAIRKGEEPDPRDDWGDWMEDDQ